MQISGGVFSSFEERYVAKNVDNNVDLIHSCYVKGCTRTIDQQPNSDITELQLLSRLAGSVWTDSLR